MDNNSNKDKSFSLFQVYLILNFLIKVLEEKGIIYPDELKEKMENRVMEVTRDEKKANKDIFEMFNYVLLDDMQKNELDELNMKYEIENDFLKEAKKVINKNDNNGGWSYKN